MTDKELFKCLSTMTNNEMPIKKLVIKTLNIDKSRVAENEKMIQKEMLNIMAIVSKDNKFSVKYKYSSHKVETVLFLTNE